MFCNSKKYCFKMEMGAQARITLELHGKKEIQAARYNAERLNSLHLFFRLANWPKDENSKMSMCVQFSGTVLFLWCAHELPL